MTKWIVDHQPKSELQKMLETPFYVYTESESSFEVNLYGVDLKWSLNEDMTDYHDVDHDRIKIPAGRKVYLFCIEDQPTFYDANDSFASPSQITLPSDAVVGGNICFLSESSCYLRTNFMPICRNQYQFSFFFQNQSFRGDIVLGFSELADYCYSDMFGGCTSLVAALYLPATTLAKSCYANMFSGCTGITDLHFPKSLENDSTFLAMSGAPKFGATNATVHYDL